LVIDDILYVHIMTGIYLDKVSWHLIRESIHP